MAYAATRGVRKISDDVRLFTWDVKRYTVHELGIDSSCARGVSERNLSIYAWLLPTALAPQARQAGRRGH